MQLPELHLTEYHEMKLEYLRAIEARKRQPSLLPITLQKFSDPLELDGYCDKPITDDLITDIYLDFSNKTRSSESQDYLRTLIGELQLLEHHRTGVS